MKAVVVYESLWGNTAAVARAIAEGIGPDVPALSTADATPDVLAGVDLLVAGSPVLAFRLPTERIRSGIASDPGPAPAPPDLSHPPMRTWLKDLPHGNGHGAAFDTEVKGPFGRAAPAISKALERAGYRPIAEPRGFIVTGKYGPLRDGELEEAHRWGGELARSAR